MNLSEVYVFKEEIIDLIQAHESANYLRVLLLAPQLLVLILEKIGNEAEDLFGSIWKKDLSDDDKEVYRLIDRLEREQNDKYYIANGLVNYYESVHWGKEHSKKSFIKYFTKLEDLISLRNKFAHEFYVDQTSNRRVKICSKGALELIHLFASHEYLEGCKTKL